SKRAATNVEAASDSSSGSPPKRARGDGSSRGLSSEGSSSKRAATSAEAARGSSSGSPPKRARGDGSSREPSSESSSSKKAAISGGAVGDSSNGGTPKSGSSGDGSNRELSSSSSKREVIDGGTVGNLLNGSQPKRPKRRRGGGAGSAPAGGSTASTRRSSASSKSKGSSKKDINESESEENGTLRKWNEIELCEAANLPQLEQPICASHAQNDAVCANPDNMAIPLARKLALVAGDSMKALEVLMRYYKELNAKAKRAVSNQAAKAAKASSTKKQPDELMAELLLAELEETKLREFARRVEKLYRDATVKLYSNFSPLKSYLVSRSDIADLYDEMKTNFPTAHAMLGILVSSQNRPVEVAPLFERKKKERKRSGDTAIEALLMQSDDDSDYEPENDVLDDEEFVHHELESEDVSALQNETEFDQLSAKEQAILHLIQRRRSSTTRGPRVPPPIDRACPEGADRALKRRQAASGS
ncbi:hypothetical protein THAOC_18587, partial [Thalassiosira oceanica]